MHLSVSVSPTGLGQAAKCCGQPGTACRAAHSAAVPHGHRLAQRKVLKGEWAFSMPGHNTICYSAADNYCSVHV